MRTLRYVLTIVATIVLALVGWSTQWEYFQWQNHLLRVNRFSGIAYELQPSGNWTRSHGP
jgi:uncharacterized protein YqhQ